MKIKILSTAVASIVAMSAIVVGNSQGSSKPMAKVDDLKWMAGNWSCEIWGGIFEEYWIPPVGGTMQGTGRLVSEGKVQFMEYMSIETGADGKLTMYMLLDAPSKGEKKPSPFVLTSVKNGAYTFTNAKNDFPTRIIYSNKKDAKGALMYVRLEGKQGGKDAVEEFNFRKMK